MAIDQNAIVAKQPIGIGKLERGRVCSTPTDDEDLPGVFNRLAGHNHA